MAGGGSRRGERRGGRRKGTPNKATSARQADIAASGEVPLDYMLRVMRDADANAERRDEMARAAAPYVHPKLAAIEHTGADRGPIKLEEVTDADRARALAALIAKTQNQ